MATTKQLMQSANNPEMDITDDYGKFKFIKGNRKIIESHVNSLMRAMKKNDLFTPIVVNDKLEVLDGQHRLEARKRLGFIVPYITVRDVGLEHIQELNCNQKGWVVNDYTDSYIELGKKDYEVYKWFRQKFGFSHSVSLTLLCDEYDNYSTSGVDNAKHRSLSAEFKQGDFKVGNLEKAKATAEAILKFKVHYKGVNRRAFVAAMLFLLTRKNFDIDYFYKKLENNPIYIKDVITADNYVDQIEELYNYKKQQKVTLKYSDPK